MARTGRFGKLPARAPDLTSTIVALIEAAAAQDDRNILSSWSEGGEFRGKKVTDQMVRDWFAKRRSQYTTDDPEYDYWDQQIDQIDYDIGESKMLLRTAGGSKADYAHAANWYKTNAKRFPRNSEAWREAMRNAAGYQKAAQEKAHTGRVVSDYEKFTTRVNALQKTKVDPAMRAVGIVDDALHRMGLSDFMSLDATQKSNANVQLQDFIRNEPEGRRFARQWKRLTGHDFTYNSLRKVIREGKRGSSMQANVARQYGYSPASFVQGAQNFESYDVGLGVFRSDVMHDYMETTTRYNEDLLAAKTPEERAAIRATYSAAVRSYEKEAAGIGDTVLAGSLRGKRLAVNGEGGGVYDNPFPEDTLSPGSGTPGAGDDTVYYNEKGGFDNTKYDTEGEFQSAFAKFDAEAIKGLHDGSYVYTLEADGKMVPVQTAKFHPTIQQYGSYLHGLDGGGSAMVYVEKKQVVVRFKGANGGITEVVMPGWTSAQIDGITVFYGPTSVSDGVVRPTLVPPWSDEGTVESDAYRTNMDRAGDAREETSTFTDPNTGQTVKRTAYVVDINVTQEELASFVPTKVQGETEAAYNQRVLQAQQAAAGGALAGEKPDDYEMGTRPERGPGGPDETAPPTTPPPAARTPTEAEVDALIARTLATSTQDTVETMNNANPGSGDLWLEEQRRIQRDNAQQMITNGIDPTTGAQLPPAPEATPAPAAGVEAGTRTYALSSPLVFSEALTSNDDLTGMTVAAMSSQKHWAQFISANDPNAFYAAVIKANEEMAGGQPLTPERSQAIADEVNQIFTLGAWGNDELEFAISRPKSSIADVARDSLAAIGVVMRNAVNKPVGQDARDQFVEQVTSGTGTMSPEEAKTMYPGLAEDIDTRQRIREDAATERDRAKVSNLPPEVIAGPQTIPVGGGMSIQIPGVGPQAGPAPAPPTTPAPGPPVGLPGTPAGGAVPEVFGPPAPPSLVSPAMGGGLSGLSSFRRDPGRYGTQRFAPAPAPAPVQSPGDIAAAQWQQSRAASYAAAAFKPAPVATKAVMGAFAGVKPYAGRAAPKYGSGPARYGAGARPV